MSLKNMKDRLFGRKPVMKNNGYCPICDKQVTFSADNEWLRDHYRCTSCGSIPRNRALMHCIETFYPGWRNSIIHESSPCWSGMEKLSRNARRYIPSQFYPDSPRGEIIDGAINIDLEDQLFDSESFDLVITQDVFEHIFNPGKAFSEIARTLKKGGAHICTIPLVNKNNPTEICAEKIGGSVVHHRQPEYHGNPVDAQGSLVTRRWGYDVCEFIHTSCGMFTTMVYIDNLSLGIRAELIEVLVSRKP